MAISPSALFNSTENNNIGIGWFAGFSLTTGTNNTFVGRGAGYTGQKVDAVNTTALGYNAVTTKDNSIQIGNDSVTSVGVGANKMEWASAIPASGTYARGDVVWNLAATAGGVPGWICVAAGTPGTWKAFGTIAV